jgi:hypothetical protein
VRASPEANYVQRFWRLLENPGSFQIRLVDPNRKGDVAGLGACMGDSGGPVFEESDGLFALLGLISWSTGPALTSGCGGFTGVTPIVRYRDWVIKTAAAMGSILDATAPAEDSNKTNSPMFDIECRHLRWP